MNAYIKKLLFLMLGIMFFFDNFLKADDIVIYHGWNLIGSSKSVRIDEVFNSSIFKVVWRYNNGKWEAYSSDENVSNLIKQKYTFFTKTEPYQGFWVYNSVESVNVSLNSDDSLINLINFYDSLEENITDNLMNGWNLIGSSEEIDLEKFAKETGALIIWGYNNGKWEAYSPDENISNLIKQKYTFFTKTEPYQGFWVYKEVLTDLPPFDNNETNENTFPITGYVIDDPIVGATIEVYDENGNLIAKEENATDESGKYSITINKNITKYLLKVSNGKINGKIFDGTLYSICFNNSCNVTPITTIIALNFAKNLKNLNAQNIQEFAQNVLGVSDYQSTNLDEIKKIREYAASENQTIDYLMSIIASDLTDGYADNKLTTMFFPNAKIRQTITKTFDIDINDIDDYQDRNLKIVNLRTGEKVDINQPIEYKDYGLNVALIEDYNYTLYDGSEQNASNIIYLPFKPYSENKLDINSTLYYYIFLDPNLVNLPETSKKDLINILNTKYRSLMDGLRVTYKNYINNGDLYKPQLNSQINFIQTELIKNELTQYNLVTNNTQSSTSASKVVTRMINTSNKITYDKNYANFGCISIKNEENKTKIYNMLPVYLGFTTTYDFQKMEEDGYYDIISSESILDSLNQKLINENPGGLVGFTVSKLFSFAFNTAGKSTPVSIDKNSNSYVIYKSYRLTSLSSILNYLDIVSKLIHIPISKDAIQKSIKTLQSGDKIYSFSKRAFDLISTGLTIADSLISINDILTDEELLKEFNIPYDKETLEKYKVSNKIKENISNLNKLTNSIQNTLNQFNIILPKPKPLTDVVTDELNITKTLENFIDKFTKSAYKKTKSFFELRKIPTYDGKPHLLLMLSAILPFYVDDKSYANYFDKFIKDYQNKSIQSAYFDTNKLSVAMYIIFNAMKAKKESNDKLDNYATALYQKGFLVIPGKAARKSIDRFDIYKATLNTLKYFYKLNAKNKRNIFDYVKNVQYSLENILSNIRGKVNLIKSIAKIATNVSKELSKKDIPTFIWEFFIKSSIEKGIETGEDIIKEKILNLLTAANPYATLINTGNEVAGKITSFVFFPNKITFKTKTDADNNIYFSSAIKNITPIVFEKGIVEPEMTHMQYAFLKKPTNNSYHGVIVASKEDPSWYRPYFETIFKESACDVRARLDDIDENKFAEIHWEYEKCPTKSIKGKYDLNNGLCQNFKDNQLDYTITGDDIDGGRCGDTITGVNDKFILPYPDKNGNIYKNGSYFDFFDYLAVKFTNSQALIPWHDIEDSSFHILNKTRGIYLDKISAKYFSFDDDSDSKFTSPEASDVIFKIASAKDFDYDVEVNNTALKITNLSTSDYPVDLTFLIIKSSEFGKETLPSMIYSFSVSYSSDASQMTKVIPISNISMLGDKITIIAVDSILKDYAKYIGIDNLMQVIYSLKDQRFKTMKEFFDIYSSQQAAYPFMKVKNITITPDNPPFIDDWNINTTNLTATLSVNATDPDGDELICSVDWGDGKRDNFNCDKNVSHTYANYGEYNVTLSAIDDKDFSDKIMAILKIIHENNNSFEPKVKWSYHIGYDIQNFVIDPNNKTLYVTVNGGGIYSINFDGQFKWKFNTNAIIGSILGIPMIDDGTLYVTADSYFYAINFDGTLKWKQNNIGAPVQGFFDDIYAVYIEPSFTNDTYYMCSINSSNSFNWKFESEKIISHPIYSSFHNRIYFITEKSNDVFYPTSELYVLNRDGELQWQYELDSTGIRIPSIGQDGTIYIPTDNGDLYAIDINGILRWKINVGCHISSYSATIDTQGNIYVGTECGDLIAINPDGSIKWKSYQDDKNLYCNSPSIMNSPIIGNNGTIYIIRENGYIYAINPDGTVKWKFHPKICFSSKAIALGPDGTLYVAYNDDIYAITTDSSGLPSFYQGSWPKLLHDYQNSGNYYLGGEGAGYIIGDINTSIGGGIDF